MRIQGKLSNNSFKIKENGNCKTYRVETKSTMKTREVGEGVYELYEHITRIAYDGDIRVGTIESSSTGLQYFLNTNNK